MTVLSARPDVVVAQLEGGQFAVTIASMLPSPCPSAPVREIIGYAARQITNVGRVDATRLAAALVALNRSADAASSLLPMQIDQAFGIEAYGSVQRTMDFKAPLGVRGFIGMSVPSGMLLQSYGFEGQSAHLAPVATASVGALLVGATQRIGHLRFMCARAALRASERLQVAETAEELGILQHIAEAEPAFSEPQWGPYRHYTRAASEACLAAAATVGQLYLDGRLTKWRLGRGVREATSACATLATRAEGSRRGALSCFDRLREG